MRRLVVAAALLALALSAATQTRGATLTLTTKPSPLGLGQNLFEVTVKNSKGQPVSDAEIALLLLMPADPKTKHPEMRTEGKLKHAGGGTYSGIVIVTMAGDWDVTITATQNRKEIGKKTVRMRAHLTRPTTAK